MKFAFGALLWILTGVAAAAQGIPTVCIVPDNTCPAPMPSELVITASAVAANGILAVLPPNAVLHSIDILNTTGDAVTGGINIGTTAGASDVVSALAVGANGQITVPPASLLKQYISATLVQPIYISAVTGWNSAVLNIRVRYGQ